MDDDHRRRRAEIVVTGKDFIEQVRRSLPRRGRNLATDRAVAAYLGISITGLANWRARKDVTTRQMVGLVKSVVECSKTKAQTEAIRPIVEFIQIQRTQIGNGATCRIFDAGRGENEHPYLAGLKRELETHYGVYIFYDSRGRALYAGKARAQNLWKEINLAYNRSRDRALQSILRVAHPQRRQDFRNSDEIRRPIRRVHVKLHELATYVSAYEVADAMVDEIESLLIRAFPNELMNKKVENFTWNS